MILYLYTYVAENSTASGASALIDCILGVQSQSLKMVFNNSLRWVGQWTKMMKINYLK